MSQKSFNKKEQFVGKKNNKRLWIIIAVVVTLIPLVFVMFKNTEEGTKNYFGEPVLSQRSYIGSFISMTPVEPIISEENIKIPLSEVDDNNIVFFEIKNNQNELVPLMAYVTPTGRIFAGSSMCEPCRGRTFSLAGETLVCDACRTTYDIEEHTFISGAQACGSYPPVNMNPVIEDDMIIIDLDEVLNWRTRI